MVQQEDHSVTFIAIGPMINLMHLLESGPDSISPQSGVELVRRKVNELVCMAGHFPSGIEWNVQMHAHSAQTVVQKWQTPIMFAGFEVGSPILTGARLFTDTPETNPVRKAYSLYLRSEGSRSSWDLTAVLYAVRGISSLWKSQGGGNVIITDAAESIWKEAPEKGHFYLQFNTDPTVILETLEELLIQPPKS
ncbi:nucleoside hydrolase [Paenibacillus alginolyticus]|uniref:nucleoside hydrolase n=1 Tax=Paenibacillus alginolyticus TaxID=59839 RepID=UPI00248351A8|nr:nucleoside hydrolase [Paenibacillus frigoriresistens]